MFKPNYILAIFTNCEAMFLSIDDVTGGSPFISVLLGNAHQIIKILGTQELIKLSSRLVKKYDTG